MVDYKTFDEVEEDENTVALESGGSAVSRYKLSEGNLALLQEFLRKDPESYRDEFIQQFHHFEQTLRVIELQPEVHPATVEALLELANFLQSVAVFYPQEGAQIGEKLMAVLNQTATGMDRALRMSFSRALVAMANQRLVATMDVLQLLFELVKCDDKPLRKFVIGSVLSIIKRGRSGKRKANPAKRLKLSLDKQPRCGVGGNSGGGGQAEQTRVQNYVFGRVKDERSICARIAQMVLVETYRRGYWRDAKTANVLAECVFHKVPRIKVSSMKFFLGSARDEEGLEGDSDSDDEAQEGGKKELREATLAFRYAKKTRKKAKQLERTKRETGREKRLSAKQREKAGAKYCNWEAINALYDPQKFSDRLYSGLASKRNEKFVIRLLQVALCARVIGVHKLQTLGFYSYIQRYLQPRQNEATKFLLYAAQASHELVPADIITTLVRCIAQNFVNDTSSVEAITVGLNAIREIFTNCPSAATEELLRDLTEYKSYRNKNVSMAARALINLFRSTNPRLLHKKDRGRPPKKDEQRGEDGSDDDQQSDAGSDESDAITSRKEIDGLPRLNDIEHFHKRPKQNKSERQAQVEAGREGREDYGKPKKRGPHVGRTNRELAKNKTFQMVRPKVRSKNRQRSFRDQQISLRNYLLRQSGRKTV